MSNCGRVVFAGLLVATAVAAGAQSNTQASNVIEQSLRGAVERHDVAGVVAAAASARKVVYHGAFGAADLHGRRLGEDAIFQIASMTKPVTSVALMQLVEEGRVDLDQPADKYLSEFAGVRVLRSFDAATREYAVGPASKIPTVRQLMTHTSGLGYNFTSPIVRDFKPRPGEEYRVGPLLFEPGERWLYGTSTDWVGRLVERVSGMSLDEYFRQRIFQPLGMQDTGFNVSAEKQARIVAVLRRQADGTFVEQPAQPRRVVTQFSGGGGLASTARDYLRFLQMLLNGGTLEGARILKAETVDQMARNQIGRLTVPALKTALPDLSNDFTFVDDGRDKWGLGFLITVNHVAGKRTAGSLSWGGIDNTYFWVDRTNQVAGVILMQFLPFADPRALAVYDGFERGVYRLPR